MQIIAIPNTHEEHLADYSNKSKEETMLRSPQSPRNDREKNRKTCMQWSVPHRFSKRTNRSHNILPLKHSNNYRVGIKTEKWMKPKQNEEMKKIAHLSFFSRIETRKELGESKNEERNEKKRESTISKYMKNKQLL